MTHPDPNVMEMSDEQPENMNSMSVARDVSHPERSAVFRLPGDENIPRHNAGALTVPSVSTATIWSLYSPHGEVPKVSTPVPA